MLAMSDDNQQDLEPLKISAQFSGVIGHVIKSICVKFGFAATATILINK